MSSPVEHGRRERFMVCTPCLKKYYGGSERSCSHGWGIFTGKPLPGMCDECHRVMPELHCPDGSKEDPA